MTTAVLEFALCAVVILVAGAQLSKYGDIIAEKTGLGGTWVGVVLLATATSLPELLSGVSAVTLFDLPNIAVGGALGSCMFNVLIIALLDFLSGPIPISTRVHQGHILAAGFGTLLLSLAAIEIVSGSRLPTAGWVSVLTPAYLLVYLVAMRMIFRYEQRRVREFLEEVSRELVHDKVTAPRAYTMFSLFAVVIVAAALWLPGPANRIAEITGLGNTFVGNVLVAIATSLPEIAVSLAAVRIGAFDLSIGNVLGSNLFNIAIISLEDILYRPGPLLSYASDSNAISAIFAIAMTSVAVIGLTYRGASKPTLLAFDATVIALLYVAGMAILFLLR